MLCSISLVFLILWIGWVTDRGVVLNGVAVIRLVTSAGLYVSFTSLKKLQEELGCGKALSFSSSGLLLLYSTQTHSELLLLLFNTVSRVNTWLLYGMSSNSNVFWLGEDRSRKAKTFKKNIRVSSQQLFHLFILLSFTVCSFFSHQYHFLGRVEDSAENIYQQLNLLEWKLTSPVSTYVNKNSQAGVY